MTLEEAIIEKVRNLGPEEQAELLEHADSLSAQTAPRPPLRSPKGLWADEPFRITEEDIAEVRREMWKNFPREDI